MPLTRDPQITIHDVGLVIALPPDMPADKVEEMTIEMERVLYEEGPCGNAFSVSTACTFDPPTIELDMSIGSVSGAIVNRRVYEVLERLENAFQIQLPLYWQKVETSAG